MLRALALASALAAAAASAPAAGAASGSPSFVVANDAFLLNGVATTLISGSFHYHRAHASTWADRLARMAAMGHNAVQFYVPWNFHEQGESGSFDWGQVEPSRNLSNFLSLAQEAGLLALVRAGPYICGEHDFGGIPSRLLNISGIVLRTNNTQYLNEVDVFYAAVTAQIRPHLVSNGGNVAMVQVENEFGSYGNTGGNPADAAYMTHLRNSALAGLGGESAVQLYTTDGGDTGYLSHGAMPGLIFATGDGGPDIDPASFWAAEDAFNPPGWRAHTDSEYYSGWLTHWSEGMANTSTMAVVSGQSVIFAANGSVNVYMSYGGTNWGFWNGANGGGTGFQPVITSYDYNSPIAEGGAHGYSSDGDKFLATRQVYTYWRSALGMPAPPAEPPLPIATAYPAAALASAVPLLSSAALAALNPSGPVATNGAPGSLESYGLRHGYAVYTTSIPASGVPAGQKATLSFGFVADLVYVWCGGVAASDYAGSAWRPTGSYDVDLPASCVAPGAQLTFLVQNAGHINYGHGFFDPKGLFPKGGYSGSGPVATVAGQPLVGGWTVLPLEMHYNSSVAKLASLYAPAPAGGASGPGFYTGSMTVTGGAPTDTYLTLCGWGKGTMWINGNHLGRYWESAGPQHAFYVPAAFLNPGLANTVVVFEELAAPSGYSVGFSDGPDFTGAVCKGETAEGRRRARDAEERAALRAAAEASAAASSSSSSLAVCPTSFAAGQGISVQDCASSGSSSAWTWTLVDAASSTGVLSLTAAPALCLAVNDTASGLAATAAAYDARMVRPLLTRASHAQALAAGVDASSPSSGRRMLQSAATNLVLAPCAAGNADRGQHFMYFGSLPGAAFMSVTRGKCFDITGGGTAAGTPMEVYGCTGNSNQAWSVDTATGHIASHAASGMCIAAC